MTSTPYRDLLREINYSLGAPAGAVSPAESSEEAARKAIHDAACYGVIKLMEDEMEPLQICGGVDGVT